MAWVVDTCVLIDVFDEDQRYGKASALMLQELLPQGLVVSPISFIEWSPAFMGDQHTQRLFLTSCPRSTIAHGFGKTSWSHMLPGRDTFILRN